MHIDQFTNCVMFEDLDLVSIAINLPFSWSSTWCFSLRV